LRALQNLEGSTDGLVVRAFGRIYLSALPYLRVD